MKRIFAFVLFSAIHIACFAGPGDTTIYTGHQNVQMTSNGNFSHVYNFPSNPPIYRKIYLEFTIGKYPCPGNPQYCASWDYLMYFKAEALNPSSPYSNEEFELHRYITPYATTGQFYPADWNHTYMTEITDYAPLLKDSVDLKAQYGGYSWGFTVSTKIICIEGTPEREVVGVHKVYGKQSRRFDNPNNSIENYLVLDTLQINSPATEADFVFRPTGHGSNAEGCGEFCEKYYEVYLDGMKIGQEDIWKYCGHDLLPSQTGTWIFDRANWCPGEKVPDFRHELDGISPGTDFTIDVDMEPTNAGTGANLVFAGHVISYKAPSHNLDASIEDIISPSIKSDDQIFNPSCNSPIIRVRNSGTTAISSIDFSYQTEFSPPLSYQWTGNLAFKEEMNIELPAYLAAAGFQDSVRFDVKIEQVNGQIDDDALNNEMSSLYTTPPVLTSKLIIFLKTNSTNLSSGGTYNETSWKVLDATGTIVAQRNNCNHNTLYQDTLALNAGSCYQLVVSDSGFHDGLNWWFYPNYGAQNPSAGYMQLRDQNTGTAISNFYSNFTESYRNGDFGGGFTYSFRTAFPTEVLDYSKGPLEFQVYPNPARDQLFVNISGVTKGRFRVQLISLEGQIVRQRDVEDESLVDFNTSDLPAGTYALKLISSKEAKTKKVIILK